MSTTISVIGTVATEPRFISTQSRTVFCTFRLASNDRWFDREKEEWVDGATNWYTINAFRTLAEHAHKSLAKGDRVVVAGRVRIRNWETDDRSGTNAEIEADGLGHDLRWGTSRFTRISGGDPAPERPSAGGPDSGGQERWNPAEPSATEPSMGENPAAPSTDADKNPNSSKESSGGDGFIPVAA